MLSLLKKEESPRFSLVKPDLRVSFSPRTKSGEDSHGQICAMRIT
jgi:hypothetical protein